MTILRFSKDVETVMIKMLELKTDVFIPSKCICSGKVEGAQYNGGLTSVQGRGNTSTVEGMQ